ncbi:hypothetical protein COK36_19515 [Bacillus cereus]|nr:hypothetical protein CN462_18150 [Bacillus cereus]PFL22738.1 hypothetical protein COJ22_16415 [Bacillus cereus]PFR59557.1 hypothetical protein COK36_19515 [Bacillus cereus]PGW92037.1 hypothetical protein COE19_17960 [Bacillus cereus]PGY99013.1 hypothetical protein COE38_00165 [Bacillus cereus]
MFITMYSVPFVLAHNEIKRGLYLLPTFIAYMNRPFYLSPIKLVHQYTVTTSTKFRKVISI